MQNTIHRTQIMGPLNPYINFCKNLISRLTIKSNQLTGQSLEMCPVSLQL
mgnify:CR=1 FL=1